MIKTREDWEHVKTVAELQSGPSLQHAVDTIEALRDSLNFAIRRYDIDGDALDELLDALPDWITKNER